MNIYIKSAGRNSNQDYWWYECINNQLVKKYDFDLGFNEDIKAYLRNESQNKLFVHFFYQDSIRIDNWGRKIKNYIYIEGNKKEISYYKDQFLCAVNDVDKFEKWMQAVITSSEDEIGFKFNKGIFDVCEIEYEKGDIILDKDTPFLVESIKEFNEILGKYDVIMSDDIDDAINCEKSIFISENINLKKNVMKIRRNKKMKNVLKKSLATIGALTILSAIMTKKRDK